MTATIGKRYEGGEFAVEASAIEAYADATDDPNPAYRGARAVAPAMFHVRAFILMMMQLATDKELALDMLRLVHGEHDVRFVRPLRPGDVVVLSGELLDHQVKASGTVVTFGLYGDVGGERVIDGRTAYFVRAPKKPDAAPSAPRPAPEPLPEPSWQVTQPVADDQALRYAAASGDHNPIHTIEAVAQAAGLPRTILHGLCTMAFAARDVVDHAAGGDPARLARLAVRFARPVFPGDTLTMQVWDEGPGELAFQTLDGRGRAVITQGRATLRGVH
jgi:acyl dehydratase